MQRSQLFVGRARGRPLCEEAPCLSTETCDHGLHEGHFNGLFCVENIGKNSGPLEECFLHRYCGVDGSGVTPKNNCSELGSKAVGEK